jgi:hypothetical protein
VILIKGSFSPPKNNNEKFGSLATLVSQQKFYCFPFLPGNASAGTITISDTRKEEDKLKTHINIPKRQDHHVREDKRDYKYRGIAFIEQDGFSFCWSKK